ncbi:FkbM family methyltransferase [Ekhidna sp.]
MLKIILYIYQKIVVSRQIRSLQIESASIDEDGHSFVRLNDGLVFYGPKSMKKERKFYKILIPSNLKKQLPFECYQIAMDIIIRYKDGNLKWGGPSKEAMYTVKKEDVIAEMGAYRGFYTIYLSQKVGPKGKIIAIEPIPENIEYLRKNIEANNLKNTVIVEKGVWNANEQKVFQRKTTEFQSASIDLVFQNQNTETIEVNTLDKILDDSDVKGVDFMLIQLNGAEYEALEGLQSFIPKHFAIAARYNKDGRDITTEVENLLVERGYATKRLEHKFVYAELK